MFILSVAPITKIPLPASQVFSYFYKDNLNTGAVVSVVLNNRTVPAIVLSCEKLTPLKKMHLRKTSTFTLKKIKKVLCKRPFLSDFEIKLAQKIAKYYYEPLGITLKLFIPGQILKKQNFNKYCFQNEFHKNKQKNPIVFKEYDYNKEIVLNEIKNTKGVTLLLVPDLISLKNWSDFLAKEINQITIFHSKLSPNLSLKAWEKSRTQNQGLIIGTKLALWRINQYTQKIIILNCNSVFYKSWDQHPKYDSRQVVKIINEELGIKVILIDTALNVENYDLAKNKKIQISNAINQSKTFNGAKLINLLNKEKTFINEENIISEELLARLKNILTENKKAILYINKKGYAKIVLCSSCAFVPKCEKCGISLNLVNQNLVCSSCGATYKAFDICPKCQNYNFIYLKLGVDFIYKKLRLLFPEIKIFRFDLNNAPKLKDQLKILQDFYFQSCAILVGTSLLFKLSPDFYPKVDLAFALNFDYDLFFPQYNAFETTYLNLLKLKALSNQLMIQSFQEKITDFDYDQELKIRKLLKYPPFYKIVKITLNPSKKNDNLARAKMLINFLSEMAKMIVKKTNLSQDDIIIQGPILKLAKNKQILNIILKFSQESFQYKNKLLQLIPIKVDIDVEPKSIL